ncbi:hypothetical protein GUJ93_ZPchr0007g5122 [Zizania palustris]|uniref:BHLH domain-containing protein n=1 Tax=Zizania palustris TaxID=103762 RepID=A0A8J5W580_ZIZPA|nr:hypothetical protein GUJ93_ZPchr0007g5122 [Zizania palustris]
MQCMAQEGSEASVASSPPAPPPPSSSATTAAASWWRDMHGHPYAAAAAACNWPPPAPAPSAAAASRWPPMAQQATTHHHRHQHHPHPHHRTSSSSGGAEDDLSASNATVTSFTNTSTNHSALSMDSSGDAAAAAAAAESHLIWNQVLMGAGGEVGRSMPAVHDAHDDSENFLELLNSRTLAPELFAEPPACDYLKKMEYSGGGGGWPDHQFTAAALVEKHMSSAAGYGSALAHHHHHHHASAGGAPERLTANLSDLVSNWSIAPPNPCLGDAHGHHCVGAAPCDNPAVAAAMGGSKQQAGGFLDSNGNVVKHEMSGAMLQEAAGSSSTSGQDFLRPMELAAGAGGYSSMLGLNSRMYGGGVNAAMDVPWGSNNAGSARSLSDLISFGDALDKPAAPQSSAPADYKRQQQGQQAEISSPAKTSSSGGKEGKKKRSEEKGGSEGNTKKSKHEATSSLKSQVPKVKLGDKITALQQIVSPFGKTDTASVLYEAINYIKWLHEQLQLLSDPYMKSSSSKVSYLASYKT